jgi:uncharacterized membrane protein YeaQ/YmgE (transglycosylase-associated protein family)
MGILSWLVLGMIAGWLAGKITTGRGFGIVGNIFAGIAGALAGGFVVASLLRATDPISGISLATISVAAAGALVLSLVLRLARRQGSVSS